MPTKKKFEPRPFGVPLDELAQLIEGSGLKVSRKDNSLTAKNANHSVRVDVLRPKNSGPEDRLIKAVVQIRSFLPSELTAMITKPEATVGMNYAASLGAVTVDDGTVYVGSRLTMYEAEDVWEIQLPLLLFSVTTGAETLLATMRRMLGGEPGVHSVSKWVKSDFEQVETILSRRCICTTGSDGLTTEFGLTDGAVSAALGDSGTALWRLRSDVCHPELGGGLHCLLEMPNRLPSAAVLDRVLVMLNQMEMAPRDLPPHFGAWCRGRFDNNPAYVSFLPNALHQAPGIAVNVSAWAYSRALWVNGVLESMRSEALAGPKTAATRKSAARASASGAHP